MPDMSFVGLLLAMLSGSDFLVWKTIGIQGKLPFPIQPNGDALFAQLF